MRVLVCGGRNFGKRQMLEKILDEIHEEYEITLIVNGKAKGADEMSSDWAAKRGIKYIEHPAKWDDLNAKNARIKTNRYGKKYNANAGFVRNMSMYESSNPNLVVCFPGGDGTDMMHRIAVKGGTETWKIIDINIIEKENVSKQLDLF